MKRCDAMGQACPNDPQCGEHCDCLRQMQQTRDIQQAPDTPGVDVILALTLVALAAYFSTYIN